MQLLLQSQDRDALEELHDRLTPPQQPLRLSPTAIAAEAGGDLTYV